MDKNAGSYLTTQQQKYRVFQYNGIITVFPQLSALGRLLILRLKGGALIQGGAYYKSSHVRIAVEQKT